MAKTKEMIELDEFVAELPEAERDRVNIYAKALRDFLKSGGKHALIALTLVGQEESDRIEGGGGG